MSEENNENPKDLSPELKEQVEVFNSALGEFADAASSGDDSEFEAAFSQLGQLASNSDIAGEEFLNSLHVPDDAGEYEQDLRRILARIPDGWGRWLSFGRGWYPLVIELDKKLAELYPDYRLNQAKEKYGTLRFYWSPAEENPTLLSDRFSKMNPPPEQLEEDASEEAEDEFWEKRKVWRKQFGEWKKKQPEGIKLAEAKELVRAAELEATKTCELCGDPGELTGEGWVQTLCLSHANANGVVRQERWLRVDTPEAPWNLTTKDQAEEVLDRLADLDPNEEAQIIMIDFEREDSSVFDNPKRELSKEFLDTLLPAIAKRDCLVAKEWGCRVDSTIYFNRISDESEKLLSNELARRGMRDFSLEPLS